MTIVEFTRSPVAAFKLGYHIGQVVELDDKLAQAVIDAGYGHEVRKKTSPSQSLDYSKMKVGELKDIIEQRGGDHSEMKKADMVEWLTLSDENNT